jgi:tetratricopeptide (TPR) repeat protein
MNDFFVSYNRADRAWAEWIAWQLEAAGYTVVVQAWDFLAGHNFVLDMQRAASEAQRTIAVLSPDYLASRFTQPEWAAAFAQDPTGEHGLLLPVRVRVCEPKGLLPQIVYVDLVDLDEATARDRLLAGVTRTRAKPSKPPQFPGAKPSPSDARSPAPRYPGALPRIWNVPHQRNPNFTGRAELLARLEQALRSGQSAALTQPQAIHGLGGVGKTQLATEYAYRHTANYDVVWWIRSEEPTTLAADYAALAQKLDLPEKEATEQALVVAAVRDWLEHNTRWLLIFDNASEPKDLDPYRPRGNSGHTLITSRYAFWRGKAQPLEVQELPRDESVKFLVKRTGQKDEDAARKLAEALGDLPLALEHAGAYIEATGISLADYLELFETYRTPLFDESEPTDYPVSITKTWDLAFQQVKAAAPAGADLLNLCAFLASDDIPLDMIRDGVKHLPKELAAAVHNPLALNKAIATLRRYSLIEMSDDLLSIHRMVQAVTRDRLDEQERKQWAEAAVRLVDEAFPSDSDDVRTWDACARLLPHGLIATIYAETMEVALDATGRLLNHVGGGYLRMRAAYAEAKGMLERALRIGEAVYGPNHPNVGAATNNLGSVLQDLGDLEGAKAAYARALRIGEAIYGPDHPVVAIGVNNLGGVLQDLGDLEGAKAAYERALRIGEAVYGPDHPTVAIRVNNLGRVLQDLGDLEGSKAAYERALRIGEAVYGPDHPQVAISVNNLGGVLGALGDLEGAKAAYERALRIDEAVYGLDHPNVARGVNNLGSVLRALGDLEGAKAAFARALRIFRQFLGDEHPYTITVRNNLEILECDIRGEKGGEQG